MVADLLGVTVSEYTASQMTYDLRRLRLKGLIFRPPRTNRYFVTPYGWKVARLFSRLEARVFRPAVAMFTGNDAVLPFPLRALSIASMRNSTSSSTKLSPYPRPSEKLDTFRKKSLTSDS